MERRNQPASRPPNRPAGRRTLILIPVIHTQADMGALSEPIQRMKVAKLGKKDWQRNLELVNQLWTHIEQTLEGLALPYERVRVYQDGLPVCGHELEIVSELAKAGSRNHRLLLKLKQKGATIMGTESSELLVEEYQLLQQAFSAPRSKVPARAAPRRRSLQDSLLERRDQYIGARIDTTLQRGETGVLLLGMLH
ncbi:MAG: hypothetical protein LAO06_10230 [Acidobacteriia bacterium]|nr:hypothetical protein [Terriglobia bacterium]